MKTDKARGRMYAWCDRVANPLEGECPNDCTYCYMKDMKGFSEDVRRKYSGPIRLSEKVMGKPIGKHKVTRRENLPFVPNDALVIFVCSGHDLGTAPYEMKAEILRDCWSEPQNFYLLQSKNPAGLKEVEEYFPPNVILGTTVETHRADLCRAVSNAPPPVSRTNGLNEFDGEYLKMISIEPVLEHHPSILAKVVERVEPDFVSVGADRGGRHNLPEPNWESVLELIDRLENFTRVLKKENLKGLRKRRSEKNG